MNKPNIVWFMLDSLRNEFLNEFGFDGERTFIDELISQGTSFTRCYSAAPFTEVSMAAKMTGCYPSLNNINAWITDNPMKEINPQCINLAEILRYNGYFTCCKASSETSIYIPVNGFSSYYSQNGSLKIPLDDYINHEGPKFIIFTLDVVHDACCSNHDFTSKDFAKSVEELAVVVKDYYEKIKSDNDLIIISSDHGVRVSDELENTKYSDEAVTGKYLTDKTTKNSFNIIWKGHVPAQKIDHFVRSVDIYPTILNILEFEYPKLDGISLLPLINKETNSLPIYNAYTVTGWSAEWPCDPGTWCARNEQYKLVRYLHRTRLFSKEETYELYDYVNDQKESINLIDKKPDIVDDLKRKMHDMQLVKRDILPFYHASGFNYNKYIDKRSLDDRVMAYATNIINNIYQKKTKPKAVKGHNMYELSRKLKYLHLYGIVNALVGKK